MLLLGEKYLRPQSYLNGSSHADNEHAFSGYNNDNNRTTYLVPRRDTPNFSSGTRFGSAHVQLLNIARCDGSVEGISYNVDRAVWRTFGHRELGSGDLDP